MKVCNRVSLTAIKRDTQRAGCLAPLSNKQITRVLSRKSSKSQEFELKSFEFKQLFITEEGTQTSKRLDTVITKLVQLKKLGDFRRRSKSGAASAGELGRRTESELYSCEPRLSPGETRSSHKLPTCSCDPHVHSPVHYLCR